MLHNEKQPKHYQQSISGWIEDKYEIMTDEGWKPLKSFSKTIEYEVWVVRTISGRTLKCADDHILFKPGFVETFAKDLVPGDLILTESGIEEIFDVYNTGNKECMYDAEIDSENHRFYASGFLSHNSTMYCVYALWLTCFFRDKKVMILANKAATALELMERINRAYEYLPNWLKPSVITYNKGEIVFSTKSAIKSFASSSDAARGWSANVVILDEFAFLPKNIADKLFTSMFPVMSSSRNGKIIVVSTPNGANLFYDMWKQANSKASKNEAGSWKPYIMWWWQIPGRGEEWKRAQIEAIGKDRFAQEFNNEFLIGSSFQKLIPDDIIEKYRMRLANMEASGAANGKILEVVSTARKKAYKFKMWHEFKEGHTYIASGDVAEGGGGSADSSVLYVWDVTDLRKITMCAKFEENDVTPTEFAFVAEKILKLYGSPFFICERNGVGSGFLDSLAYTYDYKNIAVEGKNGAFGVYSHVQVKGRACLWLKEMFTREGFNWVLYDKELLNQMSNFIKREGKQHVSYAAISGAHDDLVMALVWVAWILNPDIIDKYMIVTSTFKTSLDEIMPLTTQPLYLLEQEEIEDILKDPLYESFVEYKHDAEELAKRVMAAEKLGDRSNARTFQENLENLGNYDLIKRRDRMREVRSMRNDLPKGKMVDPIIVDSGPDLDDPWFMGEGEYW